METLVTVEIVQRNEKRQKKPETPAPWVVVHHWRNRIDAIVDSRESNLETCPRQKRRDKESDTDFDVMKSRFRPFIF